MPVAASDFLWENTGFSASGTSVVVAHPDAGGTTAGTTVVVSVVHSATTVTAPAGFASAGTTIAVFVKSNVSAGETSWTFTLNTSGTAVWYILEIDNVALDDPFDGSGSTSGVISNGAALTSATVSNAGASGVALMFLGTAKIGTTDVSTWASWTNSFTERVDVAPASGSAGRQIAVAYKLYEGWSSHSTAATLTSTVASVSTGSSLVLLRSVDASINAPLSFHTGFEFGTHAGMANTSNSPLGTVSAAPSGTWGTNYLVQSGSARNGGYGLRVVSSASIAYVVLPTVSAGTVSFGCNIKPVSGTADALVLVVGTGNNVFLTYDSSTEKFGLNWNGGTTQWQTGTTPIGTWAWVDIRAYGNSSSRHADWTIETGTGTGSQTSPADLTGVSVATTAICYLGSPNSRTGTFDYDDVVLTRYAGAYPLGQHTHQLLVPETTGASVSGTSGNFNEFTANGTLAAFASTSGQRLDEVPPTISASSDGVVQVTLAASDYMEFPMGTYTLASDEIIAGVRALASLWGGTGTGTGTLGFRGYDGTTETTFVAASTSFDPDSLTAASSTYPLWYAAQWSGGLNGAWTQTRLNAAALRLGFSTDATPDMGASAMYLEVAIKKAGLARQVTIEDPMSATVDLLVNTYSSATVSYVITNLDAARSVNFNYSISGTPQTPVTVSPSSSQTIDIHADNFGNISDLSLEPQ